MKKNIEKNKLPMKLQIFAEPDVEEKNKNDHEKPENTPSSDELMIQLAAERAERERTKNALDKALKEKAEITKKYRATLSANEQAEIAQKEQREAEQAEVKELRQWKATVEATKRYKALEMDDQLAEETAKAEIEGDMDKVTENFSKHIKAIKASAYQQLLAERPDIKAGSGDHDKNALSKEKAKEIAKITYGHNEDILKYYRR